MPAPTATADLTAERQQRWTFALGPYDGEVSFDLLRGPLRNSAGQALYHASLWGFWQWLIGAVGAFVGGAIVEKLFGFLWTRLTGRLKAFRRQPSPTA